MSEPTYRIRVTKNGNETKFDMMLGDSWQKELSYIEIIELIMQATSSLRWDRS